MLQLLLGSRQSNPIQITALLQTLWKFHGKDPDVYTDILV